MVAAAVIDMVIKVGPALPPLAQGVGDVLNAARPMTALFTDLAVAVLPALGGALQFLAPVLGPLVALFVGASLASKAWAAAELIKNVILGASAAVTTGISIATGAYNLIAAVVRGNLNLWAIAQMALNAAMAANPIGIVVVVIAALVAAIILAWNHSETFRNIVMAAWEGIKSAASVAWSILQSIFAGLMTAVRAIGDFFATVFAAIGALWNWLYATVIAPTASAISTAISTVGDVINWLWSSVIQPTFNFIAEAAKILLAVILTIVFVPIYLYITYVLAPVFTWLWQNIIQPAWEGIQAAISAAWTFISGIFNAVVTYLTGVFTTTWNFYRDLVISVWNIIRDGINAVWVFIRDSIWNPIIAFLVGIFTATWNAYRDLVIAAWNLIRDGINAAWAFIRDNIWNPIINFLVATLGPAFNLARDVLVAAWNVIRDALNAVWVFIRDNIWNPLVNFVTVTIPNAFAAGRDAVGRLWDGIKKLVRDPIQAVVDVVYNNGIVKVWNWVADKVGLGADKRLDTWTVPQFAKGGPVERPTLGLIGEAGPEYVISAPAVRAAGGMSAVEELHQSLLNKSGRTAQRETLHYLNHGGIVEGADHNGPGTSSVGFGGVQRHVAQAGNYLKMKFGIGSVGGVGARPNASDHPAGLALDFMTSGDNGTQLANFLSSAANWSHFAIKYLIWRQRILNGPGTAWQGMEDRGSPTANHMDHVHVSFQGGPGSGTMDAGGAGGAGFVFDPIQFILDGIGIDLRSITSKLGNIGGGVWGEMMSGAGGKMATSAWDWAVKQVSDWWGRTGALVGAGVGGILGSGSPDVRKMVQSVALARGWGSGPEWDAADRLIAKESSWNPNAQNPTSTAFGLFQFLDSTWGSTGYKKSASPLIQAQAGFQYIGQRYGSPSKALAFHNANNWYDGGGVANGRGIMMKNVISPERVLSNRQTAAFEELVGFATGRSYGTRLAADRIGQGYGSGSGGDAPYIGTLVVPTPEGAGVDETLDGVFLRARHETKRGRYGRPGG
jgi:SLT domain-containing protein